MISWHRYARHCDVLALEAAGWVVSGTLGHPHDRWSVLMTWAGEGDPS